MAELPSKRNMPLYPSKVSVEVQKDKGVLLTFAEHNSDQSYTFFLNKAAIAKLLRALFIDEIQQLGKTIN